MLSLWPFHSKKCEFFNGALVLYRRDLTVASESKTTREVDWYVKVMIAGKKAQAITKGM